MFWLAWTLRLLPALVLVACGSSGESGAEVLGAGSPTVTAPETSGGGSTLPPAMPPAHPLTDTSLSNPLTLPTAGRPGYSGTLSLALVRSTDPAGQTSDYTGALSLEVDFALGRMTGTAREMARAGAAPAQGVLYFTRGALDRAASGSQPTYSGILSGTLKEDADAYVLHGTFAGDFRGDVAEQALGSVTGRSVLPTRTVPFTGHFAASR